MGRQLSRVGTTGLNPQKVIVRLLRDSVFCAGRAVGSSYGQCGTAARTEAEVLMMLKKSSCVDFVLRIVYEQVRCFRVCV